MLGWSRLRSARTSRSLVRRTSSTSGSLAWILNSFTAQKRDSVAASAHRITRPYAPSPTSSTTRRSASVPAAPSRDPRPTTSFVRSASFETPPESDRSSAPTEPSTEPSPSARRATRRAPERRALVSSRARASRAARFRHARIASTAGSSSASPPFSRASASANEEG